MHEQSPLLSFVKNAVEDLKAQDLTILPVAHLTTVTDFMLICTGSSSQHVRAIAENVISEAKQSGIEILSHEGKNTAQWVLVDFGDVILHVMLEQARNYYELEKLWDGSEGESECESES